MVSSGLSVVPRDLTGMRGTRGRRTDLAPSGHAQVQSLAVARRRRPRVGGHGSRRRHGGLLGRESVVPAEPEGRVGRVLQQLVDRGGLLDGRPLRGRGLLRRPLLLLLLLPARHGRRERPLDHVDHQILHRHEVFRAVLLRLLLRWLLLLRSSGRPRHRGRRRVRNSPRRGQLRVVARVGDPGGHDRPGVEGSVPQSGSPDRSSRIHHHASARRQVSRGVDLSLLIGTHLNRSINFIP